MDITWKKTEHILLFFTVMLLLTMVSGVIHKQKSPVVLAESFQLDGVLPSTCLYEIDPEEGSAFIYLLQETNSPIKPYTVRQEAVKIEKEKEGYRITGSGIFGKKELVTYANRTLSDGIAVQPKTEKELERSGTLVFIEREGEKRTVMTEFTGIPERVEVQSQTYYGIKGEDWQTYFFYDDLTELPCRLIKWIWECVIFFCVILFLVFELRYFFLQTKKKMEYCYPQDFFSFELSFLLTHLIICVIAIFVLLYLVMTIGEMDYSFLARWLPKDRVIDVAHYRNIFENWKSSVNLFLETAPQEDFVEQIKKMETTWKYCGWNLIGGLTVSVGAIAGYHFLSRRKLINKER